MRAIIFFVLAATAFAADAPVSLSSLIDTAPATTIRPCPEDQSILAAYSERDPQWWGRLEVYHRTGDTLDWQYSFPKNYEKSRGHYVVRFRWVSLKQSKYPVLEVIESTHMGNGSFRIFELEDRELRLLLDTPIRGRFWSSAEEFGVPLNGEAHFEGEHLDIQYHTSSKQQADTILLTGTLRIENMEGMELPSRQFVQTVVWDFTQRVFVVQPPTSP